MRTYQEFYSDLSLPSWAPPGWVFGAAWGIIYPLFVAATVYLLYLALKRRAPWSLVWLLAANWAANLAFTPVQLGLRPLWPASLVILAVLGTLTYFQWRVRRFSRLIFWLLVPYLAWGLFATALQLTITFTNEAPPPGAEVDSFAECASRYPVMESYPRQCRTPDGRRFVEDTGDGRIACTADAKLCPDGSYVGRIAPECRFAPCPGE